MPDDGQVIESVIEIISEGVYAYLKKRGCLGKKSGQGGRTRGVSEECPKLPKLREKSVPQSKEN